MSASFMVDPLGLQLIDHIGVDNVMWSSDYPHNESTFGYSEKSLASVVERVGPEAAVKIASDQVIGIAVAAGTISRAPPRTISTA